MRICFHLFMLLCLLWSAAPTAADSAGPGLFFHAEQTLYRWDGTVLTALAPVPDDVAGVSLSPSGAHLIYRVVSAVYADEIARECPCGGLVLPTDLLLVDLTSGETQRIAGQPEGATLTGGSVHGQPVWSPDGAQIAWIRGTDGGDLLIYDIATGTTRVLMGDLPPQTFIPAAMRISAWGYSALMLPALDESLDQAAPPRYRFYSAEDGALLSELSLPQAEPLNALLVLDTAQMRDQYALQTVDGWTLFDVTTGATETLTGATIYAYSNMETSLRIGPRLLGEDEFAVWIANTADARPGLLPAPFAPALIMGGTVALIDRSGADLFVWSVEAGSYTITLPLVPDRIHAETVYYALVRGGNTVDYGTLCIGGDLPVRLNLSTGYVIGAEASTLYAEPDTASPQIGSLLPGAWFSMIRSEPTCRQGVAWWQVAAGDTVGWTPEWTRAGYQLAPGCPPGGCGQG